MLVRRIPPVPLLRTRRVAELATESRMRHGHPEPFPGTGWMSDRFGISPLRRAVVEEEVSKKVFTGHTAFLGPLLFAGAPDLGHRSAFFRGTLLSGSGCAAVATSGAPHSSTLC